MARPDSRIVGNGDDIRVGAVANPVTGTRRRSWRYTETRDKRELARERRRELDTNEREGGGGWGERDERQGEIEKFRNKQ